MIFRRSLLLALGLLIPSLAIAAVQPDPVAARFQFNGLRQVVQTPGATLLAKLNADPASATFRACVLTNYAMRLSTTLGQELNPSGTDATLFFKPLLDDLVDHESVLVLGGQTNSRLGFVLAVRLDDNRAKVWQGNWAAALTGIAPETFTEAGFQGSVWTKAQFRLVRAKDWLVASRGEDLAGSFKEILDNVNKTGRPAAALTNGFFQADADLPKLANWLPLASCPFKLARTQITLSIKNNQITTTINLHYPSPLQWAGATWRVPVEHVRDPIVSFTAARDLAPFLAPNAFAQLKVNPWNEQLFVWAGELLPFQTFAAIPVEHSTNLLLELIKQAPVVFGPKLERMKAGSLIALTNNTGLSWNGVQPITPALKAGSEKSGDYLLGEFMPPMSDRNTKPVPAELFQFTSHKDTAYYDWELTSARLEQWRPMAEMLPIFPQPVEGQRTSKEQRASSRARDAWLIMLSANLESANTITEASVTGLSDAKLVRQSPVGFTGFELVLLSKWVSQAPPLIQDKATSASAPAHSSMAMPSSQTGSQSR